jgi:transposase
MSLGRRQPQQHDLWIATADLPRSPGHPFYQKLNRLLSEANFDTWLEHLCAPYYHAVMGRPSIPPGVYFRMILVGYFEGIGSQRGIAWRCSDSRSLAEFLGVPLDEATPDHSSLSRTHGRLPLEVHEQMFAFVLQIAHTKKLLDGKTVAVDATTLEANAAMKSIQRKDTGEDYQEYLRRLAQDAGLEDPSDEDLRRFDKKRPDKKVSNAEWQSKTDADSRIAKMKDGTTHLAYKAEHVVDLKSDLVVAATVHPADHADQETLCDSVLEGQQNLQAAGSEVEIKGVVTDKGYHSVATVELCGALGMQTYIAEPERPHGYDWEKHTAAERQAVEGNRRRVRGARGKKLQRLRSELPERSFAHVCETGGGRRTWLRGLVKVTKRYLVQVAARNLGVIMRKLFGIGTPRGLQGQGGVVGSVSHALGRWWSGLHHMAARLVAIALPRGNPLAEERAAFAA